MGVKSVDASPELEILLRRSLALVCALAFMLAACTANPEASDTPTTSPTRAIAVPSCLPEPSSEAATAKWLISEGVAYDASNVLVVNTHSPLLCHAQQIGFTSYPYASSSKEVLVDKPYKVEQSRPYDGKTAILFTPPEVSCQLLWVAYVGANPLSEAEFHDAQADKPSRLLTYGTINLSAPACAVPAM